MSPRLRLADLPFLAATLGMGLALAVPWVFEAPAEEPQFVEIAAILPWAVPEAAPAWAQGEDSASVQFAGQPGDSPGGTAQP